MNPHPLPDDLWILIASYMSSPDDLLVIEPTSLRLQAIVNSEFLWENKLQKEFPHEALLKPDDINFQTYYKNLRAWKLLKRKIKRLDDFECVDTEKFSSYVKQRAGLMQYYSIIEASVNEDYLPTAILSQVQEAYLSLIKIMLTRPYRIPGYNLLHRAIEMYDFEFTKDLIEAGANPHCTYNNSGNEGEERGLLQLTADNMREWGSLSDKKERFHQIFRLLLEKGVDPNRRYYQSHDQHPNLIRSILHEHLYTLPPDIFKLFLEKGADHSARNAVNQTLIERCLDCIFYTHNEQLKALLDKGANPNVINSHGRTPLMTAIRTGNTEAVNYLLAHKQIDLNIRDFDGKKARDYAKGNRNVQAVTEIDRILAERATQEPRYFLRPRVPVRSNQAPNTGADLPRQRNK